MTTTFGTTVRGHLRAADCDVRDLAELVQRPTDLASFPLADRVDHNVLVYDSARLRSSLRGEDGRMQVEDELARALSDGPGVVVLAGAYLDPAVVHRASERFLEIVDEQREAGGAAGDHFAAAGQNDRIWNALEKLALRDPDTFARYYGNDVIAAICRAWLGPGYQVTSQVNVVNPGGAAQHPHRDYHLGFLSDELVEQYPTHVHRLSPVLTLQGAVAHSDMPVETGPTMYLPHSHKYLPGYLAWRRDDVAAYFAEHHVQVPLRTGDAAFFNPAVLHGAGTNRTADVRRMANLLQVSSAFGRAMEAVDRTAMSLAVHPALVRLQDAGGDADTVANAIAACAEGYPFPTNLDRDQPVDGMTPPSQADVLRQAVEERWPHERVRAELDDWAARRTTA